MKDTASLYLFFCLRYFAPVVTKYLTKASYEGRVCFCSQFEGVDSLLWWGSPGGSSFWQLVPFHVEPGSGER